MRLNSLGTSRSVDRLLKSIYVIYSFGVGVVAILAYQMNAVVYVEILKYLVLFNIVSLIIIYYNNDFLRKVLNPTSLFLSTLILFIYGRVILDVFGFTDIQVPNLMSDTRIADDIIIKTLLALIIFLSGFSIGSLIIKKAPVVDINLNFDKLLFNVGRALFYIGVIPAVYIQILTLQAVSSLGYLAIFRGEIEVDVPIVLRLLAGFFRIGFILILVSFPKRVVALKYILVFSVFIILNLLTGIRGYYMSFCLVLVWYWYGLRHFGVISIYRLGLISLFIIFSAQLISSLRDSTLSLDTFILLAGFIYDQSTSMLAIVYGIEYGERIGPLSYMNLFDVMHQSGNLIQDKIDYQVNPGAKELGHSLGGGIIQEHLLIGGAIGLFLFAIIWGVTIAKSYSMLLKFRFGIALLIVFLPNIFFSPRARTVDFIGHNLLFLLVLLIVYLSVKLVRTARA